MLVRGFLCASGGQGGAPPGPRFQGGLWLALLALGARWALGAGLELTPDEAYYLAWSRAPAWTYLDHPPLVAWLLALAPGTSAGVRLVASLCAAVTGLCVGAAVVGLSASSELEPRTDDAAAAQVRWWGPALALLTPALAVGGALMTPDAPLLAAWSVATLGAVGAAEGWERRWLWGGLVGLGVGAAGWSKASAALLVAGLTLGWWLLPKGRRALLGWGTLAGALVAAPCYGLGWWRGDVVAHQWGRWASAGWRPFGPLEAAGGWLGLLGPCLGALALGVALLGVVQARGWSPGRRVAWAVGGAPLLAWLLLAAVVRVEVNWLVVAAPGLVVAVAAGLSARGLRRLVLAGAAWTGVALGLVGLGVAWEVGPLRQVIGWEVWGEGLTAQAEELGCASEETLWWVDRYQEASELRALGVNAAPAEAVTRARRSAVTSPGARRTALEARLPEPSTRCIALLGASEAGPWLEAWGQLRWTGEVPGHPSRGERLRLVVYQRR